MCLGGRMNTGGKDDRRDKGEEISVRGAMAGMEEAETDNPARVVIAGHAAR